MKLEQEVRFDRFRLDPVSGKLWLGSEPISLTPKAFALLSYLVHEAGRLVTKEELLRTIWSDALVSDAALVVCIGEIRKALQDRPREPRFIETVHRRGYRFIAELEKAGASLASASGSADASMPRQPDLRSDKPSQRQTRQRSRRGERQVVFVTGESGGGETALVHALMPPADQ